MQGKGTVRFFLIVMIAVCLYQFLLVLPTQRVDSNAEAYAEKYAANFPEEEQEDQKRNALTSYLDSMSSEVIFSIPLLKDFTYEELKSSQLNYGLDLKGGMSVILQVDLREFLRTLAKDSKDPTFRKALDKATEAQKSAQSDYVTLFVDAFEELGGDAQKLATILRNNPSNRDDVTIESSIGEMTRYMRTKADETVNLTYKRLKDRIDEFGVAQPNVNLDAARDMILVELPGVDNPERARNFLQATAKLEFWHTVRVDDRIINAFTQINERLKREAAGEDVDAEIPTTRQETRVEYTRDSLGNITDSTETIVEVPIAPSLNEGPLFNIFTPNGINQGQLSNSYAVMGTAKKNNRKAILQILSRPEFKPLFPPDLSFRWSQDPVQDFNTGEMTDQYELYGLKVRRGSDKAPLEGDVVTDAQATPDPTTGDMQVSLRMNTKGAKTWGKMTTEAFNDSRRQVAVVLDSQVVSAPSVNGAILGGSTSITGNFTVTEANDLASILQIGKLPAKTEIIQEAVVGPSLGADNINRGISSLIIGFLLVLAFMIFYYAKGGLVSIIALLMNLFFIFGTLASLGTVLTLPGLAGILLTIGMAVDANVIIYERIREELREGKTTLMAIADGFKHSYSAIVDANVTTLLTAAVLAYFGLGPIKGFAVVLIIGVLSSLFTAVLFGRLLIDWWTKDKGNDMSFWTGMSKNAFADLNIDWLGKRKVAYAISGTIIAAGLVSIFFVRGFDLGVDFRGGYSYNIEFDPSANVEAQAIRDALTEPFGATPVVKSVSGENTFNVVTSFKVDETTEEAADEVMAALHQGVNSLPGVDVSLDKFKLPGSSGTHVNASTKIGPTIADDIFKDSLFAGVLALLLIFFYIFVRFSKWQYSLGAVAALFHDTLVVLSIFSIFHGVLGFAMEIDQPFIAAILTVIGYSINDTVVVFDRIREYMNAYTNKNKQEVVNMAINSTVSRTVITSLTTLFMVLMLFIFGAGSIKGFAFALLIGVLVGTYSSIFIATPIMSDFTGELKPKAPKKKSFSKAASAMR
ncbi:MAG: protein translocase subunit SecDF [Bacteroidota bacterium]